MRFSICDCGVLLVGALLIGCRSSPTPSQSTPAPTTRPILYHRTGGIAGTDDRVVIWPDGFVDVTGELLPDGSARLPKDRLDHLVSMFAGWDKLNDRYLASGVADGYTITISFGDKTVEAWDLAPNLPLQFREIFAEIEAIAAQAQAPPPAP